MSLDAPSGIRCRRWPRLAVVIILLAIFGLIVAWMVQPEGVTATALFEVRSDRPSLVGNQPAQPSRDRDFKILKNTQLALLKSKFLLTSALRNPTIGGSPVFAGVADYEAWLQDHL